MSKISWWKTGGIKKMVIAFIEDLFKKPKHHPIPTFTWNGCELEEELSKDLESAITKKRD